MNTGETGVRRMRSASASRHSDVFLNPYPADAASSAAPAPYAMATLVRADDVDMVPSLFTKELDPAPAPTASSSAPAATTESMIGRALLEVQSKKADVL